MYHTAGFDGGFLAEEQPTVVFTTPGADDFFVEGRPHAGMTCEDYAACLAILEGEQRATCQEQMCAWQDVTNYYGARLAALDQRHRQELAALPKHPDRLLVRYDTERTALLGSLAAATGRLAAERGRLDAAYSGRRLHERVLLLTAHIGNSGVPVQPRGIIWFIWQSLRGHVY